MDNKRYDCSLCTNSVERGAGEMRHWIELSVRCGAPQAFIATLHEYYFCPACIRTMVLNRLRERSSPIEILSVLIALFGELRDCEVAKRARGLEAEGTGRAGVSPASSDR